MSTNITPQQVSPRRESKRALLIVMAIAAVFIGIATSGNQTSSTPPSSSYRSPDPKPYVPTTTTSEYDSARSKYSFVMYELFCKPGTSGLNPKVVQGLSMLFNAYPDSIKSQVHADMQQMLKELGKDGYCAMLGSWVEPGIDMMNAAVKKP
jgi:hypothetical protein